jgi:hypothetical protein
MPESLAQENLTCPTCGGVLIQKSKARLVIAGLAMIASVAIAWVFPWFWLPGTILALSGIYLLIWATLGRARWCRNCKKFSVSR